MKVHITLVGGQTAPVYQGLKDVEKDIVILIHSDQSYKEAKRIHSEVRVQSKLVKLDPVDIESIKESINDLFLEYSQYEEVSINITSGTKLWSIYFYAIFSQIPAARLFYIDQNSRFISLSLPEVHKVDFDIDAHFRIYGNELSKYDNLEIYDEDDIDNIRKIKNIRRYNYREYNELVNFLSRKAHLNRFSTKEGSFMSWNKESKTYTGKLVSKKGALEFALVSNNIKKLIMNTGWFEVEVALILVKWNQSKEIRLNCVFQTVKKNDKNEIDIIVNTGNKLLFVECKTQIKNITDIDKFGSAVRNYGGSGSKALFITEAPMTEKAIEKCIDNKVLYFSLNGENNKRRKNMSKSLFSHLDLELPKTNIR